MKTCEQYSELVPALAEEVLSAAEADEVRSHVAGCAACSDSWKIQELITRHLRETDLAADKPDYYWAKQRKHILDQVGFSTSRVLKVERPRRPFLKIAVAAAAVVLVAVGVFAMLRKPEEQKGGIVRKKTWMDDQPPIVKQEPKEAPETPEEPPKKDEKLVDKTPPPPYGEKQAPDVQQPQPEKQDPPAVVKDKPAPNAPTTTEQPPKEGPVAPKDKEALAVLPGSPMYAHLLAQEQADILMPLDDSKSPVLTDRKTVEQALAILKSAGARIEDIRRVTEKDAKADIRELVDAYCVLVSEGAMPLLIPIAQEGKRLGPARKELQAQQAELESKFSDELKKGALAPALQTCLAANDLKIRRHAARSSGDTGALAAARDVSLFIAHPGTGTATIPLRAEWGQFVAGRIQTDLLEHVRAGRGIESDGHFAAYRTMTEAVVRMLQWLDPKDAARVCAEAKKKLQSNLGRFRSARATDVTRPILAQAPAFIQEMIEKITAIEVERTGKLPKQPDKKDPKDPPNKDPDPPKGDKPEPPPFGESNPPSPPPAPPPPFGEQPK